MRSEAHSVTSRRYIRNYSDGNMLAVEYVLSSHNEHEIAEAFILDQIYIGLLTIIIGVDIEFYLFTLSENYTFSWFSAAVWNFLSF